MEYAAGPPSQWLVTLKSGSQIELWADAFSEDGTHYVFGALVDATPEEFGAVEVTSWPPPSPGRSEIVVAKIPVSEVDRIESAPPRVERG
jgi:hypothetical protein